MDLVTAEGSNYVSVLQVGGFWRGMNWNPGQTKFITQPFQTSEEAEVAVRAFANEHHINYKDRPLVLKKTREHRYKGI